MAQADVHSLDALFDCFADEAKAHAYVRDVRWPNGVHCPRCGHLRCYEIADPNANRLRWKCGSCAKRFTVTTLTPMERSHIPLRKWLFAMRMFAGAKNAISAKELERHLGLSYEAAWFMLHRIREAAIGQFNGKIGGPGHIVEVDEAYQGGKKRGRAGFKFKRGRGAEGKKIVLAMIDRTTRQARTVIVPGISQLQLKAAISEHVHPQSTIVTDTLSSYGFLKKSDYLHMTVDHSSKFTDGIASTNLDESFFSLIKNAIRGTYKSISAQHAQRYLDEFTFRWNTSKRSDGERFATAVASGEARRLFYHRPVGATFAKHPQNDNVLVRPASERKQA